ncbi:hypothetical protein [Paracoccus sp. SSK6]|uniref:hypothetical protein n=1 Tax=Paracoccus sp. SSK6 TaxID=3143131 RepID=UPI0032195D8A
MRYVSNSVRTGFVNALAILIFAAQLPHIANAGASGYAVIAAGLAVIYLAPRLTASSLFPRWPLRWSAFWKA